MSNGAFAAHFDLPPTALVQFAEHWMVDLNSIAMTSHLAANERSRNTRHWHTAGA
jgi:hypothetical protein